MRKGIVLGVAGLLFLGIVQGKSHYFGSILPIFQSDNKEIDSLIVVGDDLYAEEKYDASLAVYNQIIQKSLKENYSKGLVKAYIGSSFIYFNKGQLDVSSRYLVKAKNESYVKTSPEDLYLISFQEALNLHSLGIHREAIKKYLEAIAITERIKDEKEQINMEIGAYVNIGDIYETHEMMDSALYYYKIAFETPEADDLNQFISSVSIAEVFTDLKELDSAKYYLDVAREILPKINSTYTSSVFGRIKGKFHVAEGENEKGILAYKQSLVLADRLKIPKPELYKLLSEAYQNNGEMDLSIQYLKRYVEVNDSLNWVAKRNLKGPLLMIQTDNEKELAKATSNTWYIIVIAVLSISLIVLVMYRLLKKQKLKNLKGKKEKIQLEKKLNNAFEEVAELAKSNSPNFMSRFVEVYPEFYNQLNIEFPDLTAADLKLCALMKLDFSTKEIAEITFSSIRTIQNRKYKLRKKFELNSEENLQIWIQNFHLEAIGQI